MKYTIYQIKNKINGKIYIGKHQTENLDDGYFGSGVALREAVKKYGKENFLKEILFVFDSEDEMNAKERELITEDFVKRKDTYNLGVGGEGGPHFKGKSHTKESINKMLENRTKPVLTHDARQKISESNRRRTISNETRKKISDAAIARYARNKQDEKIKKSQTPKVPYIPTDEHKRKISNTIRAKGIVSENTTTTITCPYCKKEGQMLAMKRHHFDNCKFLRISEPVSR